MPFKLSSLARASGGYMKIMSRVTAAAIAAAGFMALNVNESNAGLIGSSVDVAAYYPNQSSVLVDGGVTVVGSGVEYPQGSFPSYSSSISIDLTDNQILISLNSLSTSFNPAAFNGFGITALSWL